MTTLKNLIERAKTLLNELAWKNACGEELTKEITEELRVKYPQLPMLKSESIDAKISWLIKYVEIVPNTKLIGLKVSNIGKIEYIAEMQRHTESIIICIGDTDINNRVKTTSNQGLYHMKYGENNHWEQSKRALHLIPRSLKNGKIIKSEEPYKYEILYHHKATNCIYTIGIPSNYGDETVLITCMQK